MSELNGSVFFVALVKVPLANPRLLAEQARLPPQERVSVEARVINVPRTAVSEVSGPWGVSRLSARPNSDHVSAAWKKPSPRGRGFPQTSTVAEGRCIILQFSDYLVLAQAFTTVDAARTWIAERRVLPVPVAA